MKQLTTVLVMLLVSACYIFGFSRFENAQAEKRTLVAQSGHHLSAVDLRTVNVYFKKIYLDGETTVDVKPVTVWSMEDFRNKYAGWRLVSQNKHKVVFEKKIKDISPILKTNGYFGLSKDGILTIYKGRPDDEKAIHSFFQIDVKKLETGLQHELRKGIPVQSTGHYRQVIEHLKKYAGTKQ